MALLLAVGCTKEKLVSRDHDIDSESSDINTKMEMSVLYCNLRGVTSNGLTSFGEYVSDKKADVVAIVAPATVEETNFAGWLDAQYAGEESMYSYLTSTKGGNPLVVATLVKKGLSYEDKALDIRAYQNPVLHISVNGINLIVTEFDDSKNEIPADWKAQIDAKNPLVYNPDNHATRTAELSLMLSNTANSKNYMSETKWLWCVNMNAPSSIDINKYSKTFARKDYYLYNNYDEVDGEGNTIATYDWSKFLEYAGVSENLEVEDSYFDLNEVLSKKYVDCATINSKYTPSSVDGARTNFLYASNMCWNMFNTLVFDEEAANEMGIYHYPIMVTFKTEE